MMEAGEERVALVTGAGSGIGQATCLAFARAGYRVVVVDVNESGGRETAGLVSAAGGEAMFRRVDVTRADEVEGLIEAVVERFGRLDCAHNNAGILGVRAPVVDYPEDDWSRVLAVNLTGVWLCMKYELRQMVRQGGGAIVNTASAAGVVGDKLSSAYVASKHGVIGLTRAAALEVARNGIRVNAVCPAFTRTPMVDGYIGGKPGREEAMAAAVPLGRLSTAEEVADAVVWLSSDGARFITGHSLLVDGGLTIK